MRTRALALPVVTALVVGVAATPASAEIEGTVDIRATLHWFDPAYAEEYPDEPRVFEATDVVPGDGPELSAVDEVENPSGFCGDVLVDLDAQYDGIVVSADEEVCNFTKIVVEITSDEIDQVVSVMDAFGVDTYDSEQPAGLGADLAIAKTATGVTLTWTATREPVNEDDYPDFNNEGLAFLGYVTEDPFPDVSSVNPFAWHIGFLDTIEVAEGYADGTYRPTAAVSRQAMAAFLFRTLGDSEYVAPEVSPFVDVAPDQAFYREIAWLAESGISTGTVVDGKAWFRPAAPVSRQAMAAFLHRAADLVPVIRTTAGVEASPFTDVDPSNEFYGDILWLAEAGISTGTATPDGVVFRPASPVSRQAMAAFLVRFEFREPELAAVAGELAATVDAAPAGRNG